ncbi:MAG: hypothetical protein ABI855_04070 [Bacteroidota bacterium]
MKRKLLIIAVGAFMLFESSCRSTVVAGRPAPRHHWWHHRAERQVIIVR